MVGVVFMLAMLPAEDGGGVAALIRQFHGRRTGKLWLPS
ncbi:hypothetical protein CCC_02939 [Paramagnetospirillum magnetotacticum MS-1]|uniref:Uncharacterized protein n=1 Tax=Paramagnetospirillum magnetotacticum MS-1 TaxID=272627 RepID=A0A0C2YZT9_PARME|nr:hypothetical protein CCC_02939 [Paramagnetospirillum magnetotacticum MS-1]